MGAVGAVAQRHLVNASPASSSTCRLVVRRDEGLAASLQFVIAGLEAGQQVFAMAGPTCLKELGQGLGKSGCRTEMLLHTRRLVFLTAPDCVSMLLKPGNPFQRAPLQRNSSLLRWLSDWSWLCPSHIDFRTVLDFERRVHQLVHSITALSLCTVDGEKMQRSSLLALLADHRRATRAQAV